MSLKAFIEGQKAYNIHLKANKARDRGDFSDAKKLENDALALYEKALQHGCDIPRCLMSYAVLLMRSSRFQDAHDLMLKIEKLPLSPAEKRQLRLNFAVCQWKLGKLDAAIEQMQRVAADGKNSMIYGTLGYLLILKAQQTGSFEEAAAFNEEALEYDDEDASVLDNVGRLKLAMGDRESARECFTKAHRIRPRQVDTMVALAKMSCDDGDFEAAKAYLEKALQNQWQALCVTTEQEARELLASIAGKASESVEKENEK